MEKRRLSPDLKSVADAREDENSSMYSEAQHDNAQAESLKPEFHVYKLKNPPVKKTPKKKKVKRVLPDEKEMAQYAQTSKILSHLKFIPHEAVGDSRVSTEK